MESVLATGVVDAERICRAFHIWDDVFVGIIVQGFLIICVASVVTRIVGVVVGGIVVLVTRASKTALRRG